MSNTIVGKFPDFTATMKSIRKGSYAKAFSRRFAVVGGSLMFKSLADPVGVAERAEPILFDHYQYLKEVLEEDLNA